MVRIGGRQVYYGMAKQWETKRITAGKVRVGDRLYVSVGAGGREWSRVNRVEVTTAGKRRFHLATSTATELRGDSDYMRVQRRVQCEVPSFLDRNDYLRR